MTEREFVTYTKTRDKVRHADLQVQAALVSVALSGDKSGLLSTDKSAHDIESQYYPLTTRFTPLSSEDAKVLNSLNPDMIAEKNETLASLSKQLQQCWSESTEQNK